MSAVPCPETWTTYGLPYECGLEAGHRGPHMSTTVIAKAGGVDRVRRIAERLTKVMTR